MKKITLILACLFALNNLYADQLAYISKEDAYRAINVISKAKKVIQFCGCCDKDIPLKVKITSVEAKFTNYENYYEVYITYKDSKTKKLKTSPIDLAYLWVKIKGEIITVGKVLGLEHDPCIKTILWR